MGPHTTDQEKLTHFKHALAKKLRIRDLILFGSRAKGTARPDSDYDLLLVSPDFATIPFRDRALPCMDAWDVKLFPTGADFLCYTPTELTKKRRGINIVTIALNEGIHI